MLGAELPGVSNLQVTAESARAAACGGAAPVQVERKHPGLQALS